MPSALPQLTINGWLRFDAIARALRITRPRSILEIGTGEGALGAWLARRFDYVGVEPDETSRARAMRRLGPHKHCLVDTLEVLRGREFDLVCAFEVLEHIVNDADTVVEWTRSVVRGGSLLISVPANPRLFGAADERVGHLRRYDRVGLERLLREAGWPEIDIQSYGAGLGHLVQVLQNVAARNQRSSPPSLAQRTAASGRTFQTRTSSRAGLNWLLTAPFRLGQRALIRTDLGTGYVALARHRP